MKKFLTITLILTISSLSANATTQVFYGNTGVPSHATYNGRYNKSVDNFGSNAGFTPQNIRRQKAIERAQRHEDQYYNGLEKGKTINVNINNTTINNSNSNEQTKQRKFVKNKFLKDRLKEKN